MLKAQKNSNHTNLKEFLFVLIFCTLLLFFPLPTGLTEEGKRVLIFVIFAIILWMKETLSPALTALLLMALFPLFNIISYEKAIAGLGSSSTWLLIGIFTISAAMQETGLDKRIALFLLKLSKGEANKTLFMTIVTTTLFLFILPSTVGRVALMIPICLGMIKAMHLGPDSNIAKSMLLSISFTSFVGSIGFMTGSLGIIYAVGLFESLVGYSFKYLEWAIALFPGVLIINFSIWIIFLRIFPPEYKQIPGGLEYINIELNSLGKIKKDEIKISLLIFLMISLWILGGQIGLSISQTCLVIAILAMLPGIEIITLKKAIKSINWEVILLLSASLAMVNALTTTNAIDWLAGIIFNFLNGLNPYLIGLLLMIILGFLRLGFPNLLAMISATFPLIITIAISLNINPIWLGLIGISSSVLGLFLPTQSMAHLATYNTGYYTIKDMQKAGFFTAIIVICVTMFFSYFYWPLLGISPIS